MFHCQGRALFVLVETLLLLVSAIRCVPKNMSVSGWQSYCLGGVVVLEKLLDKINVGHDHAAAAVSLQTELVHSVTEYVC